MQQKNKKKDIIHAQSSQSPAINVTISRIGINGEGISGYNNKIVFIPNMLVSEQADIKIVDEKDNYYLGEIDKLTKQSNCRINPSCKHYYECGVCTLGHTTINNENQIKKEILIESLNKYYGTFDLSLINLMADDNNIDFYRNKVTLPIRMINGKNYFGLLKPRTNHFKNLDSCMIQSKEINAILLTIINSLNKNHINGLSIKEHEGEVAFVIVRVLHFSKQAQITFVLVKNANLSKIVTDLTHAHDNIVSISKVINTKIDSKHLFNDTEELIYGEKFATEEFLGLKFKLLPSSFFQLNTPVALNIYLKIKEIVGSLGVHTAIDAYSGAGAISFFLSSLVNKVYAIDIEKNNFMAAKKSLLVNNITNVKLINKDFFLALKELTNIDIQLIVFDPSRVGLGQNVIDQIIKMKTQYLLYLSCNPSTLAKDLFGLKKYYEICSINLYNMFPRTPHIETLVLLKLKSSNII